MEEKEFEKLVRKAIKELPSIFREKMENVVVLVQESPDSSQTRRFGKNLLGLYEGVPLDQRGQAYSGAMPDKITIFKNNIEAGSANPDETIARVKHVVKHEIAHHFGIDDDWLRQEGTY